MEKKSRKTATVHVTLQQNYMMYDNFVLYFIRTHYTTYTNFSMGNMQEKLNPEMEMRTSFDPLKTNFTCTVHIIPSELNNNNNNNKNKVLKQISRCYTSIQCFRCGWQSGWST